MCVCVLFVCLFVCVCVCVCVLSVFIHVFEHFSFRFQGFSKLLVGLGQTGSGLTKSVEIVDLEMSSTSCQSLDDFPLSLEGTVGGLGFDQTPRICGGFSAGSYRKDCYIYSNRDWTTGACKTFVKDHRYNINERFRHTQLLSFFVSDLKVDQEIHKYLLFQGLLIFHKALYQFHFKNSLFQVNCGLHSEIMIKGVADTYKTSK